MKRYTSILEKSIYKAKISIDEIHLEAIENEGDPYYILREEITKLRRIKDDLREVVDKSKESKLKTLDKIDNVGNILNRLSSTYEKIEYTQLELDKADQEFDSQLIDIKRI